MKKLGLIMLLVLTSCKPLTPVAKPPTYGDLLQACAARYPLSPLKIVELGNHLQSYLLEFNDCQRNVSIAQIGTVGVDLIDLAYDKKARVYKKFVRGELTAEDSLIEIKQIEADFYTAVEQRVANRQQRIQYIQPDYSTYSAPVLLSPLQQPSTWMVNQGNKTFLCNNIGGTVNCN